MTPRSKLVVGLAVLAALVTGVVLAVKATSSPSVGDLKAQIRSRVDRLCRAYRIGCRLEDSRSNRRVQLLTGKRDGETTRIAITYGDVPWSQIRKAAGCPHARDPFACPLLGMGGVFDAQGVAYYGPPFDPNQPSLAGDEGGLTPLESLQVDLGDFAEPSVLAYARFRGWDDWNEYFDSRDTRPLEPCRPGYRKTQGAKVDGSSLRKADVRGCLLVSRH